MTLVPFHLGWRGLQNRRAGFESWKEPPAEPHCELRAAWRAVAHNELDTEDVVASDLIYPDRPARPTR